MSDNVGVLFCGGEGTRMRPLTYYLQKVMMPIGADQIPLLEYVIKHFKIIFNSLCKGTIS